MVTNIIPEESKTGSDEVVQIPDTQGNSQVSYADAVSRRSNPPCRLITKNECASTIATELAERDKRKCNVVFFNVPEQGTTKEDRKAADVRILEEIGEHLGTNPINPIDHFRLGKARDDGSARPLLIKLSSEIRKQDILCNAKKCKGFIMEGQQKQLGISPDRTIMEREEVRKTFRAAKEGKESEGQKNLLTQH